MSTPLTYPSELFISYEIVLQIPKALQSLCRPESVKMGRENRGSFGPLMKLAMMGLVALLIAGGDLWSSTVAFAQDDQMGALSDEYAQLESQGMKENFIRQVSFTIL